LLDFHNSDIWVKNGSKIPKKSSKCSSYSSSSLSSMVGICQVTKSHHNHRGQKPTMVGFCHGGNVPISHDHDYNDYNDDDDIDDDPQL